MVDNLDRTCMWSGIEFISIFIFCKESLVSEIVSTYRQSRQPGRRLIVLASS